MKAILKQCGIILPAVFVGFALALTALTGIGMIKPLTAYAEGSGVGKEKLTTPIDVNETDIDQMTQYGYAYYYTGSGEYGPQTLVLDGLNMETTGGNVGEAILFHSGAATLVLKDGSTNRIKVLTSQNSNDGYYHSAIYSYGSLTIQGSGSLIIEYVDQTVNTDMGRILSAISVKVDVTFAHTGSVTVTTQNLRIITAGDADFSIFNVCYSETGGVVYRSGDLFLNAGSYDCEIGGNERPGNYTMFNTEESNVTLAMTEETGGSIGWTSIDTDQDSPSFCGKSPAPSGIDTSGVYLLGGPSPDSLTPVATIDDLTGKKSAKVGYTPGHTHTFEYEITKQPTETETGTAEGFCADDGASDTLTLPVLTDAAYTKVSHAATTEADAYDAYTYFKEGVTLTFLVVHADTKLPAGGGNGDNGGDKAGLSGGAIAGIAIGSTIGVLLVVYILGYFLFFAKGKLAGNFFTAIYQPMSELFKK